MRHTILKGNDNQHTLEGNFKVDDGKIVVNGDTTLKHETPSGNFAEHHTLPVDKGVWIQGEQVEFNPFDGTTSQIWD